MAEENGQGRNGAAHANSQFGGFSDPIALNQFKQLADNTAAASRQFLRAVEDPRRDIDAECGYPPMETAVTLELYRQFYDRHAIAARVVEVMPKESWQVSPTVYENEDANVITKFEEDWDELGSALDPEASWYGDETGSAVWEYLLRADIMTRIGHFGIILIGIDDGKNLSEPVDGIMTMNTKGVTLVNGKPVSKAKLAQAVKEARGPDGKRKVKVVNNVKVKEIASRMPDSFMQESEEKAILSLHEQTTRIWNPTGGEKKKGAYDERHGEIPALNAMEKQAVARMRNQREAVLNEVAATQAEARSILRKMVTNAAAVDDDFIVTNEEILKQAINARQAKAQTTGVAGAGVGSFGVPAKTPPIGAAITGTDIQYAPMYSSTLGSGQTGMGMPPAALSGTDQQYFGIQFGPSEVPVKKKGAKKNKLVFIRPFDESLVQIVRYEWNVFNPRFGMPIMYRVTLNDPRELHSGIGLPMATVFVHWTRVIHLTDERRSSQIFGIPSMRPVINNLIDLRKIYGADAEAYWKNAFMKISLETHPQLGGDVIVDDEALRNMMEDTFNSSQHWFRTSGMTAKSLAPVVVSPREHVDVQIEAICIKIAVPQRVFQGSERGQLASTQDDSQWNDVCRARENFHCTPRIICPFINRLIAIGVLSMPESYIVEWPDLDSLTDDQKAGILQKRTMAFAQYVSGGVESLLPPLDYLVREAGYTEEEAREILEAAVEAHAEQEKQQQEFQQQTQDALDQQTEMHQDALDEQNDQAAADAKKQGFKPTPPPGFHDPAQADKQHEQSVELAKASKAPIVAGGGQPPQPPEGQPPSNKQNAPVGNWDAELTEAEAAREYQLAVESLREILS